MNKTRKFSVRANESIEANYAFARVTLRNRYVA